MTKIKNDKAPIVDNLQKTCMMVNNQSSLLKQNLRYPINKNEKGISLFHGVVPHHEGVSKRMIRRQSSCFDIGWKRNRKGIVP